MTASIELSFKKVIHVIRIETDELEVTKPKVLRKRVRILGERILVPHLQEDGTIHWYEK